MKTLIVHIEREGTLIPVGRISGEDANSACFCYFEEYVQNGYAAVSVSLPLRFEPFSPEQTRNFFEGLLPEGFTRRSVAQWMHVEENDYLSLLHGLGRECLGAVCVTEEGETPEGSYERVTKKQVQALAAEGAVRSAQLVTKSHLSLTGASGKVGLYYDAAGKEWYLPWGIAPSTHIVKQSHIRLDGIVTNEQLCLMTAGLCGISVPKSFIINTGAGAEYEVLFATQRYDRLFPAHPQLLCDLPRPYRLHQEDFAQAMGIPASEKYEREPMGYLKKIFELLRSRSANPIQDQLKLWDMLVFDWLIGNTDAHIKNFSLLYGSNQKTIRLAPAYDIVSTAVYEQSTRDMAFQIGNTYALDEINEETFRLAARQAGLGEGMAMRRLKDMTEKFKGALSRAARELSQSGFPMALEMEQRILENGGVKNIA